VPRESEVIPNIPGLSNTGKSGKYSEKKWGFCLFNSWAIHCVCGITKKCHHSNIQKLGYIRQVLPNYDHVHAHTYMYMKINSQTQMELYILYRNIMYMVDVASCLDQFCWISLTKQSSGYWGPFLGGKAAEVWSWPLISI